MRRVIVLSIVLYPDPIVGYRLQEPVLLEGSYWPSYTEYMRYLTKSDFVDDFGAYKSKGELYMSRYICRLIYLGLLP